MSLNEIDDLFSKFNISQKNGCFKFWNVCTKLSVIIFWDKLKPGDGRGNHTSPDNW